MKMNSSQPAQKQSAARHAPLRGGTGVDIEADSLFDGITGLDAGSLSDILSRSLEAPGGLARTRRRRDLETDSGRSSDHFVVEVESISGSPGLVFVKRSIGTRREINHYEELADKCSLPRCYGALRDGQGRELLFLEFLPQRVSTSNPDQVAGMLDVLSTVNAAQISSAYDREASVRSIVDDTERWPSSLATICDALRETMTDCMASSSVEEIHDQLLARAEMTRGAIEAMEFRPDHNDPHVYNFGFREQTAEVVMFDLHAFGYKPRFYGASNLVLQLARFHRSRLQLAQLCPLYLEQFNRKTGQCVSLEEFKRDCVVDLSLRRFVKLHRHVERWRRQASGQPLVIDAEHRRSINDLVRLAVDVSR